MTVHGGNDLQEIECIVHVCTTGQQHRANIIQTNGTSNTAIFDSRVFVNLPEASFNNIARLKLVNKNGESTLKFLDNYSIRFTVDLPMIIISVEIHSRHLSSLMGTYMNILHEHK